MTDHHAAKALAKRIVHAINVGECWEDPEHEGEIAIVTKLLTAALTPLEWSATKPSKQGWYWYHDGPTEVTPEICYVMHTLRVIWLNYSCEMKDIKPEVQWAGPLTPPLPPPQEERT